MAISIDWDTKTITVPKSDLALVSGTLYSLDTDWFRGQLNTLQASEDGMAFPTTHTHSTEVTIAGTTYARSITIINGYTVTFEDGQYAVRLDGSNNNIFDEGILNRNQVSVIPTNSAGLATGEIWDTEVEGDVSARELLRVISAALAGKLSGAAGTTVTIRDINDTTDRITATVDADGNRSAVTVDAD